METKQQLIDLRNQYAASIRLAINYIKAFNKL